MSITGTSIYGERLSLCAILALKKQDFQAAFGVKIMEKGNVKDGILITTSEQHFHISQCQCLHFLYQKLPFSILFFSRNSLGNVHFFAKEKTNKKP